MTTPEPLPPDLAAFRDSYVQLFGSIPPLPEAKFAFSSDIDPEALRLAGQFLNNGSALLSALCADEAQPGQPPAAT